MPNELNNQETPKKRKRRTKAEIEAAKMEKEKIKEVEKSSFLSKKEVQPEVKQQLSPEQSVILLSCLNPRVSKDVLDSSKRNGVEVVVLEDRIIFDYLKTKEPKAKSIGEFLDDTSNRIHAEQQCQKLWNILTVNGAIESSEDRIFTRVEVVKKTNLTHSNASKILELLRAFGLVEFTKGNYEFKLNFDKKSCHKSIEKEIMSICDVLNNDILRYNSSIASDNTLTYKEQSEARINLEILIHKRIKYGK